MSKDNECVACDRPQDQSDAEQDQRAAPATNCPVKKDATGGYEQP